MNNKISKYSLDKDRVTSITLPRGSKPLRVGVQRHAEPGVIAGYPFIWIQLADNKLEEEFCFARIATGESFDADGMEYVGTFEWSWLVWHVYQVTKLGKVL